MVDAFVLYNKYKKIYIFSHRKSRISMSVISTDDRQRHLAPGGCLYVCGPDCWGS